MTRRRDGQCNGAPSTTSTCPNRRGRALRHKPRMDTGGEREQRLPYRCWLASDRIAVAQSCWPALRLIAWGLRGGLRAFVGKRSRCRDPGSRARNPALERNHWGQRVRVEGKGDKRQRPCVADEAAGPSPIRLSRLQGAARRATAIPTTSTVPLEGHCHVAWEVAVPLAGW